MGHGVAVRDGCLTGTRYWLHPQKERLSNAWQSFKGFAFDKGSLEIDSWAPGLCTWSVVLGQEMGVWTCSISSTFNSFRLIHRIKTSMFFIFKAEFWKSNLQNICDLKNIFKFDLSVLRFKERCILLFLLCQSRGLRINLNLRSEICDIASAWLHNLHSRETKFT